MDLLPYGRQGWKPTYYEGENKDKGAEEASDFDEMSYLLNGGNI